MKDWFPRAVRHPVGNYLLALAASIILLIAALRLINEGAVIPIPQSVGNLFGQPAVPFAQFLFSQSPMFLSGVLFLLLYRGKIGVVLSPTPYGLVVLGLAIQLYITLFSDTPSDLSSTLFAQFLSSVLIGIPAAFAGGLMGLLIKRLFREV